MAVDIKLYLICPRTISQIVGVLFLNCSRAIFQTVRSVQFALLRSVRTVRSVHFALLRSVRTFRTGCLRVLFSDCRRAISELFACYSQIVATLSLTASTEDALVTPSSPIQNEDLNPIGDEGK
jgi:hypothetical protein